MKRSLKDILRYFPKPWGIQILNDIDRFQLGYLRGEPYFHSDGKFYGKSLKLSFHKILTHQTSFYILSLEKTEDSWEVLMKEPHALVEGVGLVCPKDIRKLVNKLNDSIRSGLECDAENLMKKWLVYQGTFCRNTFLPLVAEKINFLPENYSSKDILLTYQNGRPVLFQNGAVGHEIGLSIGECGFAEYSFSVVRFSIMLEFRRDGRGYRVTWEKSTITENMDWYDTSGWLEDHGRRQADFDVIKAHYSEPDEKFAEAVSQCNLAIQRGEVFSFADFMDYLLRWDKTANLLVSTNTLYF